MRYYLNIRDRGGVLIEDPDGDEATDLAEIRSIADRAIKDILARPETYGEAPRWDRCIFEITDGNGVVVDRIPFSEYAE